MTRSVLRLVLLAVLIATAQTWLAAQKTQPQQPPAAKPAAASTAVINLNTATAEQLVGLPGIGVKMAARILEYRQKNGPFKKVEDLMNVKGIGEKNFLKLKSRLTVTTTRPGGPNGE